MIKPIVWMIFALDHHLGFALHNFIKVSFLVIQLSLFADLFPLPSYYIYFIHKTMKWLTQNTASQEY
jgi:uncharacterized membrane protein required for colicin V production